MRFVILIFGVFCCSTSVIFIKNSETDPIALSAYRLILGGLLLAPLALRQRQHCPPLLNLLARTLPPAILLGIHFVFWIIGARMTPSANASLIVNMVPIVMPFLLFLVLRERVTRLEIGGTLVAMVGVLLLGYSDFSFNRTHAWGDLICFLSMLFYAGYLIFARKNKDLPSIYLYAVPVYILAGLFCLLLAISYQMISGSLIWLGPNAQQEWIAILGLAFVPTVLGHSIINWALQHIRGQAVVVLNLAQFIFAGCLGFLLLNEVPSHLFYFASTLVIIGAIVVIQRNTSA
jgi:drug/metabolite transporter (DMT)-like permease